MLKLAQNEYFNAFLKTTHLLTIKGTSHRQVGGNLQILISKTLDFREILSDDSKNLARYGLYWVIEFLRITK